MKTFLIRFFKEYLLAFVPLLFLITCADSAVSMDAPTDKMSDVPPSSVEVDSPGPRDDDDDNSDDYLPPETEAQFMAGAPVVSLKYVYVLNETLGTVARIDPETLKVYSVSVGNGAKDLTTLPGEDAAVVSVTSRKAVLLIDSSSGNDTVTAIQLSEPYTDISVSPDGNFVVAYYHFGAGATLPENVTEQNYSKIAIINIHRLRHENKTPEEVVFEKSVSARTTDVLFSEDSTKLFVVSKSDVLLFSLTEIDETYLAPRVAFGEGSYDDVDTRECILSPDGSYLFIRNFADNKILVIDTVLEEKSYITLSGVASDMDISPDGVYLLVVERAVKEVAIVPIPDGIIDAMEIQKIELGDVVVGQAVISPVENLAVLFTTAEYREEIMLLNLESGSQMLYGHSDGLDKAVKSAVFSPDGKRLLFFHYPRAASLSYSSCNIQTAPCTSSDYDCITISGADGVCLHTCDPEKTNTGCANDRMCVEVSEDSYYCIEKGDTFENIETDPYEIQVNQSEGYSIFNITQPFFWTKILDDEVSAYAFSKSSEYAGLVIKTEDANTSNKKDVLQVAKLDEMLVSKDVSLPSPALFAGAFPESEMFFVLQEHPVGRITFVDIDNDDVRTVTGFELNSEIE